MTYQLVRIEKNGRQQIMGTIWAGEEADARMIACTICGSDDPQSFMLRQTEINEMPLRLGGEAMRFY